MYAVLESQSEISEMANPGQDKSGRTVEGAGHDNRTGGAKQQDRDELQKMEERTWPDG